MESTLSLTLDDLSATVGTFLGYGRGLAKGDTEWTTEQQAGITECLASGLRQFYFPPPLPGERSPYDWSFLKPVASLTLDEGEQEQKLPDDFGGFEGRITVVGAETSQNPWAINLIGEGALREAYAVSPTRTGRILAAALVPLRASGVGKGQRFKLTVFPIADQSYTLQFRYYLNPDALTASAPYPYGGTMHAETIREAVLMAAENFLDDGSQVHQMKFTERLAASIGMDRRMKPQQLGYNGDNSDVKHLGLYRGDFHREKS